MSSLVQDQDLSMLDAQQAADDAQVNDEVRITVVSHRCPIFFAVNATRSFIGKCIYLKHKCPLISC